VAGLEQLPSPHPGTIVLSEHQRPKVTMSQQAIINFGAPRSGTTFMQLCLKRLPDILAMKLPEMRKLHPAKSADGLIELARWFSGLGWDLTFVRTVRHPVEIVESFEAARFHPALKDEVAGLARNTDADVLRWIRSESEGFHAQCETLRQLHDTSRKVRRPVQIVEVRYENLASEAQRGAYARLIAPNHPQVLEEAFAEFGRTPARTGRLSHGIGRMLNGDRRAWFEKELADVIEREGYA